MKRLLILTLILALCMSLLCFVPTIMAEGTPATDGEHSLDFDLRTTSLNKPIYNNTNHYINITKPEIFASTDDVLAVKQGKDVIVKIENQVYTEPLKGAAVLTDGDSELQLKKITLSKSNVKNGYIFLTYGAFPHYRTMIYKYVLSTNPITKIGSFSDYLKQRNITTTDDVKALLDGSAANISYVKKDTGYILYVSTATDGKVFRIKDDGVTALDLDTKSQGLIIRADSLSVNTSEDIFIKTSIDQEGKKIYKKPFNSNAFTLVADNYPNLIDISTFGNYIYVLESNKLSIASKATPDTPLYTYDELFKVNKCLAFNVSDREGLPYVSFAIENNDNISSFRMDIKDSKPVLVYDNHYGANCVCDTPHQGWYNKPTRVTANTSETTVYVVDNSGKRLVISALQNEKYIQHFYNVDKLLLDHINNVEIDRQDRLYLVSDNTIYVYENSNTYKDDELPLTRVETLSGFDGNIIDIKILNRMTSTVYVLTDKNSVYTIDETSRTPNKVFTATDTLVSIYPSYDGTRIYTASEHGVKSYALTETDLESPITTLDVPSASIGNIYVDYEGNIYASTDENVIRRYQRTGDNTYSYSNTINTITRLNYIADFFIDTKTKNIYIVDSLAHTVVKDDYTFVAGMQDAWRTLYANENDIYSDANAYDDDLMYVAKTNGTIKVYTSPINYEMYTFSAEGEYFYIVATDKANNNMYRAVNTKNEFVYLKKTDVTRIDATKNSIYGNTMMPLNDVVNIYNHPFENAESSIDTTTGTLTLVHNVGYDNGKMVWQNENTKWFKVSYMSESGVPLQGYAKMNELTSNTTHEAPATREHLRVTTKAGETATMYDAPDIAAGIVQKGIKNGTLVRLMQDEFDKESEFTLVELEIEDVKYVGYMLTENLQENTFTTLQIVAIIVSVITLLITIVVIILIITLKKRKDNINTFKPTDEQ